MNYYNYNYIYGMIYHNYIMVYNPMCIVIIYYSILNKKKRKPMSKDIGKIKEKHPNSDSDSTTPSSSCFSPLNHRQSDQKRPPFPISTVALSNVRLRTSAFSSSSSFLVFFRDGLTPTFPTFPTTTFFPLIFHPFPYTPLTHPPPTSFLLFPLSSFPFPIILFLVLLFPNPLFPYPFPRLLFPYFPLRLLNQHPIHPPGYFHHTPNPKPQGLHRIGRKRSVKVRRRRRKGVSFIITRNKVYRLTFYVIIGFPIGRKFLPMGLLVCLYKLIPNVILCISTGFRREITIYYNNFFRTRENPVPPTGAKTVNSSVPQLFTVSPSLIHLPHRRIVLLHDSLPKVLLPPPPPQLGVCPLIYKHHGQDYHFLCHKVGSSRRHCFIIGSLSI